MRIHKCFVCGFVSILAFSAIVHCEKCQCIIEPHNHAEQFPTNLPQLRGEVSTTSGDTAGVFISGDMVGYRKLSDYMA